MTPRRFVVGLTGGMGTGKTTALAEFKKLGATAICLDEIAHDLARPGRSGYRAILKAFGPGVRGTDGGIDRAALGKRVFANVAARRRLENATHPGILREMLTRMKRAEGVVVVDVPLLFEKKLGKRFDATILVACQPKTQLRRILHRGGLDARQARLRMRAQWPLARKKRLADITIDNDSTKARLRQAVRGYAAGLKLISPKTSVGFQSHLKASNKTTQLRLRLRRRVTSATLRAADPSGDFPNTGNRVNGATSHGNAD